jgi:hypothetical protein
MRSLIAIFVAGALLSSTVPSSAAPAKWMIGRYVATEIGYYVGGFAFTSYGVCVYHYYGTKEAAECTPVHLWH